LYIVIFRFFAAVWWTTYSKLRDVKYSLNLICSLLLHEYNLNLLSSFPNIQT
jgi:hypothetical protein